MTAIITVAGGLTSTPEIRVVGNGTLASFTVASTERYKKGDEWVDGKKLWLRCSAWRDIAAGIEGSLSSLDKGTQVTVTGKLHTREYEDNTGAKRSSTELEVTDFSVSVKRATVQVTRTGQGGSSQARTATNTPAPAPAYPQPATDGVGDVWGAPDTTYPAAESLPF